MLMKNYVFLAYLLLLPLDSTDYLSFSVGPIHITILDLMVAFLLFSSFMESAISKVRVPPFIGVVCTLLMVAAAISSISFLYIPYEDMSFDVKVTLNMVESAALILVAFRTVTDMAMLKKSMAALSAGVIAVSIATVMKSLGMNMPGGIRQSTAHLGPFLIGVAGIVNMNGVVYLVAVLPMALLGGVYKHRTLKYLVVALFLLATLLSYSRGVWLTVMFQLLAIAAMSNLRRGGVFRKAPAAAFLAGVALFLVMFGSTVEDALLELRPTTVAQRLTGYYSGMEVATKGPLNLLFGAGKGQFVRATEEVPHNLFIDLLVSKGLLTLLVVMLIFYMVAGGLFDALAKGRAKEDDDKTEHAKALLVVLAGMFMLGMSVPMINSTLFWTLVAIACAFISYTRAVAQSGRQGGPVGL